MSNSISNTIDTVIAERNAGHYVTPLFTSVKDEVVAALDEKVQAALTAAESYSSFAGNKARAILTEVGLLDEPTPEPEEEPQVEETIDEKVSRLDEAVNHLAGLVQRLKELAENRLGARL